MIKIVIVAGSIALFLVLGRVFPFARVSGFNRIIKNLLLAVPNAILSPVLVVPISAFAAYWALQWRPEWWNGGAGLALDLLLLDAWIYWWHRANHLVPFLWRFHEVHHLDETLDASSALRFHFGEVFLSSLVRAAVIFAMAMPLTSVVVFETLVAVVTIFHHSNVLLPTSFERRLSYLVVTPSIHWVHHHAKRSDTDSNYSTFLSAWDFLFGSRSNTMRNAEMPIGVDGKRDEGLAALIRRPFLRIGE
jgi:sterol desaturase/sphingolipid hydroxylase (fatty acid hydroxylase superfamily)